MVVGLLESPWCPRKIFPTATLTKRTNSLRKISQEFFADRINIRNVLKQACFGHDERPGRYAYGDCIHPCNGRPGCEWQTSATDSERYDTSIKIPQNLADGRYVLQWVGLVGNAQSPYYSCSLLQVTGGTPSLNCPSGTPIKTTTCLRSGGSEVSRIMDGTSSGPFCYSNTGVRTCSTSQFEFH